ncbi:MAG TPA: class I SAM-dependent RNA methyltransferase [Candidatus Gallacutalibacter stercoravium]|nr:class I SAM-dependent RNA methyltransferase [Candidatus Gallacutalibacter stercoravium]
MQAKFVCPCLLGVEGLVARELREMGAEQVEAVNGRVYFTGGLDMLARANLCCRYAERVLIQLGSFPARSFEELFEGVRALPWEAWIGKADAFPVKGRSINSKLFSIPDCQSIIKKAVVERLKQAYRLPWFEETGPVHQIQFFLMKDKAELMLDTSGPGLHKRGYRAQASLAPIKETLAAVMANLARVRADTQLIDPCCGSGTILIEGALLAMNIAPGLRRRFAAERWAVSPAAVWRQERQRAQDLINHDAAFAAQGYDIDQAALDLTMQNAQKAGVASRLTVEKRPLENFVQESQRGTVVCNPPYGERLLDVRQAQELYQTMGKLFTPQKGWSYSIISPDEEFEQWFGRAADKRRKLYNGMIKCQLYQYFR